MYLSCGDALFDLFGEDDGRDVASVRLSGRVGGSPLNVALGLARLGHSSGFFTKLSEDLFGRRLAAFMDEEKIDRRYSIMTDRHTTLAIVSLDESGTAVYDFYIDGTADRSIEAPDIPADLGDVVGIHVASYSTVTEPTASTLRELAHREHSRKFISYDPNIRASIEPDIEIWRRTVGDFVPLATLVKASEEDLEALYPGRAIEDVQREWLAMGAEAVVITLGREGSRILTKSGLSLAEQGQSVQVVDTVGAGDTFQAGLIAWLIENDRLSREGLASCGGEELRAMLRFATQAAAHTCSRRGADLPRRADLGLEPITARSTVKN